VPVTARVVLPHSPEAVGLERSGETAYQNRWPFDRYLLPRLG
jgi:hypothetical protein